MKNELSMRVNCDSSELDAAIAKLDAVIMKAKQAEALGVPTSFVGEAVVASAFLTTLTEKKTVSRRSLFMWWRR